MSVFGKDQGTIQGVLGGLTHRNYSIRCHRGRRNGNRSGLGANGGTVRRGPSSARRSIRTTDGRGATCCPDRPSADAKPVVHGCRPFARTRISSLANASSH